MINTVQAIKKIEAIKQKRVQVFKELKRRKHLPKKKTDIERELETNVDLIERHPKVKEKIKQNIKIKDKEKEEVLMFTIFQKQRMKVSTRSKKIQKREMEIEDI